MSKLTPGKKCLLILSLFNLIILIIFIPISACFNLWGLSIGWGIGAIISFISMALLFESGKLITSSAQTNGSGTGLSILFYFVRFILMAGALVLCALLSYKANINVFKYSLFTCAGSSLPSALIITIFYKVDK